MECHLVGILSLDAEPVLDFFLATVVVFLFGETLEKNDVNLRLDFHKEYILRIKTAEALGGKTLFIIN